MRRTIATTILALACIVPAAVQERLLLPNKEGSIKFLVIGDSGTGGSDQLRVANRIAEARKDAKPGEIFTPEIRQLFRRLMYPETKWTDGAETKAAMAEEKHELKDVKIRVNASYPDGAPLMTVPPNILAALPKLPEDLEFRFVSKHMILLDVHANLIVDYVLNAIQ